MLAKVTRDRIMRELHRATRSTTSRRTRGTSPRPHTEALDRSTVPAAEVHRRACFVNVRRVDGEVLGPGARWPDDLQPVPRTDATWLGGGAMSAEDLEKYEAEMELQLYREYRDVVGIFKYVVETDRRFYLCNQVDVKARTEAGDVFFEVSMTDAWVWDMYRPARFAKNVKVLTFKDVNVEELAESDLRAAEVLTVKTRGIGRFRTMVPLACL